MGALTPEIVAELLAKGMTQSAIAKEYDVSRQYVHTLAKQAGHHPEDRSFVTQHIPWQGLTAEHKNNSIYHALRSHARAQLRGDEIVKGQSRVRLWRCIENLFASIKLSTLTQIKSRFPVYQTPEASVTNLGKTATAITSSRSNPASTSLRKVKRSGGCPQTYPCRRRDLEQQTSATFG